MGSESRPAVLLHVRLRMRESAAEARGLPRLPGEMLGDI